MNIVAQIFSRKRQQETERVKPLRQQFVEAVRDLAAGKEVDEDAFGELLDALSIGEDELNKTLKTQHDRFQASEHHERCLTAQADVDRLTQEQLRLSAEHDAFYAKWQPKARAVADELRAAQNAELQFSNAKNRLLASVIDPELIERQAAIDARRKEIGAELRELQPEVADAQKMVNYLRSRCDEVGINESRARKPILEQFEEAFKKRWAGEHTNARQALTNAEAKLVPLLRKQDELRRQQAEIDREQAELDRLKLVP